MKAVVVEEPGKIAVKQVETPEINDREVLVKVIMSSICNVTDAHIANGTFEGYHDFYPQILGHEVYGEVVEKGKEVQDIRQGDRLVWCSLNGAFCEYVKLDPVSNPIWARVPAAVPHREAPLYEMCHGAYLYMVHPADVKAEEHVLIVGQGPLGLTATMFSALNAKSVITVDTQKTRLEKSLEVGASCTYDRSKMSANEIVAAIEKATGGVNVAFMCIDEDRSPELDAWDMAVKALRPGGRMSGLVVAVKNLRTRLNPNNLIVKNIRLQHLLGQPGDRAVFQQALDFAAQGRVSMAPLVTHEIGFEGVAQALDMTLNRPSEVIKVIVHPS